MLNWEAHACLPLHPQADFSPLDRLRAAGVNYVSVNVGMDMNPVSQILAVLAAFRANIAAHADRFRLVSSVPEIRAAAKAGVLAVGFDLEGAMPLLEQPDMVALYRDLGVRQIHLAYNRNNSVADGCHDVERGLTPLGLRTVKAVNDAGLLMDCSHTGRRCSLEIMAASSRPVIFSHANPLALVEHGRNISDEQIKACAATGGVVCVSGVSAFLGTRTPTADDVARHAAYVAGLVGVQHVGIGLDISFRQDELNDNPPGDYDPAYWWPKAAGYNRAVERMTYTPVETWRLLPEALQKTGMSAAEAAAVMGDNMLHVAGQVWHRPAA
ncbi:dipeptidase [Polaromonas jejuensis]|uniref:Dipeptidase n=1 Tax=Polaromonas jejuensis TaxID=457502 RepID=A0ABW0Q6J5_9BURK|nr:membrane dipeptidase [Polaromonas jejuensis]